MNPYQRNYRRDGPETSRHAGEAVPAKLELWQRIREVLEQCGPLTTEGIAEILERPVISISPRMVEMEMEGMAHRAGKAKNRSGKSAITWAAGARESSPTSAQTIQPGNQPQKSRAALKAEIVRLDAEDKCWEALALTYKHGIGCVMEMQQVI
jgi:hypothetical protein